MICLFYSGTRNSAQTQTLLYSELFDVVDFDTTDNDQATVERECPPPLFELQFDEHFESDCVTEDEVDIENIN